MNLTDKILIESIKLVKLKGVTFYMDDIANALGISKKTIYKSFNSKEVILKRIIEEARLELKSSQRSIIYDNSISDIAKLSKIIRVIPKDNDIFLLSNISSLRHYYPELYEYAIYSIEQNWEPIITLIEDLIAKERIRPVNIDVLKAMYMSAYTLVDEKSNKIDINSVLEEVIDIILNGVLKKAE